MEYDRGRIGEVAGRSSSGGLSMPSIGIIGKRGVWVIPAALRKQYELAEGTLVIAEATPAGILLRPAKAVPVERYSDERKAALLLNAAVDEADYQRARGMVQRMGLDPDQIPHERPR